MTDMSAIIDRTKRTDSGHPYLVTIGGELVERDHHIDGSAKITAEHIGQMTLQFRIDDPTEMFEVSMVQTDPYDEPVIARKLVESVDGYHIPDDTLPPEISVHVDAPAKSWKALADQNHKAVDDHDVLAALADASWSSPMAAVAWILEVHGAHHDEPNLSVPDAVDDIERWVHEW